jgi:hypothetical protein
MRAARSEGHSATPPGGASSGRKCEIHSCRTSGTHDHTVSTLRGFGAEPVVALPYRT